MLKMSNRRHITIANFYPITPVLGGGHRRIYFLARELSRQFAVTIISLGRGGDSRQITYSDSLQEVIVASGFEYNKAERAVAKDVEISGDLAYAMHWDKCTLYQNMLKMLVAKSVAVISAHPYSIYAIEDAVSLSKIPIIFDSQNVEVVQKRELLANYPDYLTVIYGVEKRAIEAAALRFACSPEDILAFQSTYECECSSFELIPNGVDALGCPVFDDLQRADLQASLNLSDRLHAIFAGSFHYPNFEAVDAILKLARDLPELQISIMGSIVTYPGLKFGNLPSNIHLLGTVSESEKWVIFSSADIGLNPMLSGSGSNIKMFEYAAAKQAILTTSFGARGIDIDKDSACIEAEIGDFYSVLKRYTPASRKELRSIGDTARTEILEKYDWSIIGRKYRELVSRVI